MSQTVAGRVMPIIAVASVNDVRNFYVDTLGFQHVMGMVGKDGQFDFCTVVLGEARVMFSRAPGAALSSAAKQPVEFYLEVDDVDALHDRLRKKGVAISDPLTVQWWGDRTFKVLDPNGYEIWFYTNVAEPKPPQGAKLV
ncbi:MAG: VOC family protein [Acidobacteria bacterium]|nr:VOC family protein [Acidobacteriota bacterium]